MIAARLRRQLGAGRVRSVLAAGMGTAIGSSAGAVLPFVIAHQFGVNRGVDVYFVVVGAVQMVAYLMGLVAEAATLPVIAGVATERPHDVRGTVRSVARTVIPPVALLSVLALAAVAGIVLPAAGISVAPGSDAFIYLIACAPLPIFATLSGLTAAGNYSLQRYALTTGSQFFRAGCALVSVLLVPGHLGLVTAAIGMSAGELLRFLFLYGLLPKGEPGRTAGGATLGGAVLRLAGPTMISSAVIAVNPLIDKSIAARVGAGAPTILELAEKVYYIPSVLLVAAVSKVSAAHWARLVATHPHKLADDYKRVQLTSVSAGTAAAAVLVGLVALISGPGVAGARITVPEHFVEVLIIFMLGLPFALSADLSNSVIIVLRRARVMPGIAVFLVLFNLAADILGAQLLGVAGIALASTGVRVASCLVSMYFARRFFAEIRADNDAGSTDDASVGLGHDAGVRFGATRRSEVDGG